MSEVILLSVQNDTEALIEEAVTAEIKSLLEFGGRKELSKLYHWL